MSKYSVKEIYYTLQGEGYHTGRPAVFCRFAGCNLWTGREADRHRAICKFCDTDFWGTDGVNGGKYDMHGLSERIAALFPGEKNRFVVFTGGEPALQLDADLIAELKNRHFEIAIETNGTIKLPANIDWVCMSPKADTDIVVRQGDELKLVYPQEGLEPADFEDFDFSYFFMQPMDNPLRVANTEAAVAFCKAHPRWRLSLQTHKYLNIP